MISEKDDFCQESVDETWVNRYYPLKKRQSMELHRESSPRKKSQCADYVWGKTMDSVFWNREGISVVGLLE